VLSSQPSSPRRRKKETIGSPVAGEGFYQGEHAAHHRNTRSAVAEGGGREKTDFAVTILLLLREKKMLMGRGANPFHCGQKEEEPSGARLPSQYRTAGGKASGEKEKKGGSTSLTVSLISPLKGKKWKEKSSDAIPARGEATLGKERKNVRLSLLFAREKKKRSVLLHLILRE